MIALRISQLIYIKQIRMSHLILVRHGQSEWNLENRFTGWVDVDLAPKGKLEACKAGELIKKLDLNINHFFLPIKKEQLIL